MLNLFKKIAISFIAIMLVSSQLFFGASTPQSFVSAATQGDISLHIDLNDEIHTKSNRMTFDVWARDTNNEKIDNAFLTVTNNGNAVGINWSDEVKTSYTVYFDEGINNLHVLVNYEGQILERSFVIEYEYAEDGEIIGEYTFSMDGFVVGLDYIIEPIKLPIINGDNAAVHLERILEEYGFTTNSTGSPESGYYLGSIEGGNLLEKGIPEIPQAIIDASNEFGGAEPYADEYYPDQYGLGEFDFNYMSGWMYAVNNVFPNVGFTDTYLMADDIMRVQFTVAYGSDIGGGYAMGGSEDSQYFEHVNKDYVTEIIATINSSSTKDILLNNPEVGAAYDHAFETVRTVDVSQEDLNIAEEQLRNAYETTKIAALIELIDKNEVHSIFYDINKLTTEELNEVTNLSNLDAQAQAVTTTIEALPATKNVTLADEATINDVTASFAALNEQQQKLVRSSTIATLTATQEALAPLVAEAQATAQPVIDLINALPTKDALTLADKATVLATKHAFDALTDAHQAFVTNAQALEEALILLDELQIALNNLSITTVINQINSLTTADSVTLEDETSILVAQAAYDALDDTLKADVTNAHFLDMLAQVLDELRVAAAKFQAEIQAAINLIAALPAVENVILTDESQLVAAQNTFDVLTDQQQALVTNTKVLTALTTKINELKVTRDNQEAATKVDAAIQALPATVVLEDTAKIQNARTQFTNLTPAQQALVQKLFKLTNAESQLTLLNSVTDHNDSTEVAPENSGISNNRPSDDRETTSTSSSSSKSGGSSGGSSATNNTTTQPAEAPITTTTPTETLEAPIQVEAITVNEHANTITIAVESNTAAVQVTLTPAVLEEIRKQSAETVVLQAENNISIEVPIELLTTISSKDSTIHLEVKAEKHESETNIKFILKEQFTDGSEREIPLKNKYITVKFPLTLLTMGPTASLAPITQDEAGVILRVVDGEYKAVPHQIKNGEVSIYANANDEYVYVTETITFDDIEKLANKADVEFLASRYVVNGTSDTTFEPNKSITRAQFGAMIARALNLAPTEATHYADTLGKWYEADIQALYEAGITNAPGDFNPGATLSREHAAVFMHRVMAYIQMDNTPSATAIAYADQEKINVNYAEAIATLNSLEIMQGKDGNVFDPKGHLTRAQMAKILRKTLEEISMM